MDSRRYHGDSVSDLVVCTTRSSHMQDFLAPDYTEEIFD